jgi:DNA-directed RNA polymerase specialized sigma24 family protein
MTQLGARLPGEIADVSSRRFDTDDVLQKIMEKERDAFEAFYERYRGRVYRFIVRQYGTGDFGKAGYYSAWRHLVISSRTSKTPKDLKFNFFQYLGQAGKGATQSKQVETHSNYLPRDLEEDGKWSVAFIEQFKRLPDAMKKRFLFKHEIGLSATAIARILGDSKMHIEKSIEEAERMLRFNLDDAGCPASLSLDKLYRESRVVKPPSTWDSEILESFSIWLKQAESPQSHKSTTYDEGEGPKGGFGEKVSDWIDRVKRQTTQLKSRVGSKGRNRHLSTSHR